MRFVNMVRSVLPGLVLALSLAAPGTAAPNDCGTIIIPPGVGLGPGSDITSFNPLLVQSEYNLQAADLMFAQLVWIDRDHKIDYSRSVASAVTTPDQGKTYNVALRPWHWSDGVPVTAADVAYTLHLIRQLGTTYTGYGTGGMPDVIQSFTSTDPTHFTIVLRSAVNPDWFIMNGLQALQPLPAHIWGRYTLDQIWQNQSTPKFFSVVDGPLVVRQLVVGQDAVFVPNPRYDGPAMHFARFILKFENSEGMELQAVESHEVDISNLPFSLWNAAQHLPGLHIVALAPSYSWHELIPNMANKSTGFFADVRVRDAMADAIDQRQIVNLAFHGHGDPVYGPVPPDPASFLSPAARANNYPVAYDPGKARALLAAAGYTPGIGGIMQKNGKPFAFTLMIPADQTMRIEMAEVIQQDFRAAGIDMKVAQVEFNQMMALNIGPAAGWQAMLFASDENAYPTGESNFKVGSFYDTNGYASARMDHLIDQSTNQPGQAGLFAYEDYASAQQPVIFLPVEAYAVLVRDGLHGVKEFLADLNPYALMEPDQLYCTAQAS